MLVPVLLAATALIATPEASQIEASPSGVEAVTAAPQPATAPDDAPPPTINEFIPEDRAIGDCISALPKPGCGSEARGGWRQSLILLAILGGLGFIAWRVVRSARRAKADTTIAAPAEPS